MAKPCTTHDNRWSRKEYSFIFDPRGVIGSKPPGEFYGEYTYGSSSRQRRHMTYHARIAQVNKTASRQKHLISYRP